MPAGEDVFADEVGGGGVGCVALGGALAGSLGASCMTFVVLSAFDLYDFFLLHLVRASCACDFTRHS